MLSYRGRQGAGPQRGLTKRGPIKRGLGKHVEYASSVKQKQRAERKPVPLDFSQADAQDFPLSTCSHIPAQGAQAHRCQAQPAQACSPALTGQRDSAFLGHGPGLTSRPIRRQDTSDQSSDRSLALMAQNVPQGPSCGTRHRATGMSMT